MPGRTLLSAFLTFIIFFLSILVLEGPGESEKKFYGSWLIQVAIYGGAFIIGWCFGGLLVVNAITTRVIKNVSRKQAELRYLFLSMACSIIPILLFTLFDYTERGRFYYEPTFFSLLGDYWPVFIMAIVAVLINRKIVWNNFKEKA